MDVRDLRNVFVWKWGGCCWRTLSMWMSIDGWTRCSRCLSIRIDVFVVEICMMVG